MKSALQIRIGVENVWDNVDCRNERTDGSWDVYLESTIDYFAWVDDIITNLEKEKDPGIKILISDYY